MTTLNLDQASRIIDGVLKNAQETGLKPLTVAVLDAGGHLVAFKRQDKSGILRPEIAFGKAYGALGFGLGSRELKEKNPVSDKSEKAWNTQSAVTSVSKLAKPNCWTRQKGPGTQSSDCCRHHYQCRIFE